MGSLTSGCIWCCPAAPPLCLHGGQGRLPPAGAPPRLQALLQQGCSALTALPELQEAARVPGGEGCQGGGRQSIVLRGVLSTEHLQVAFVLQVKM